jgi:hypothetical protein
MLRGSRDFASGRQYQQFLRDMLERLNLGRKTRLVEELKVMQELPERRLESYRRERVKVGSGGLIYVDRNVYSVPSRLIGERVEARLYMNHVEIWYGQRKVEEMPRLRGRRKHRVDYRHILTGWYESQAPLRTIAIARSCFPRAGFAWCLMAYKKLRDGGRARSTYGFWNLPPRRARERCTRS